MLLLPLSWQERPTLRCLATTTSGELLQVHFCSRLRYPHVSTLSDLCRLGLGPYSWWEVGTPQESEKGWMVWEEEIAPLPSGVEPPVPTPRALFFDIEVKLVDDSFPSPHNRESEIVMLSVLLTYPSVQGYLITTCPVPSISAQAYPVTVVSVSDERELLQLFLSYSEGAVHWCHYYGNRFDLPYLRERARLHGLPHTFPPSSAESIDLWSYYSQFSPHLPNHRLQTVALSHIGEKKGDVTVQEMKAAVSGTDLQLLARMADYCLRDSWLLYQLWLGFFSSLTALCNRMRVTRTSLLQGDWFALLKQMLSSIAPQIEPTCQIDAHDGKREVAPGYYRNVHVYDYTAYYTLLMRESPDPLTSFLGSCLEGAPPALISWIYYSRYVVRDRARLLTYLASLTEMSNVVYIQRERFACDRLVTDPYCRLLVRYPYYVALTEHSYLYLQDEGRLERVGRGLFSLQFPLLLETAQAVVRSAYSLPCDSTTEASPDSLAIAITLKPNSTSSLVNSLIAQWGKWTGSWVKTTYLMCKQGPLLSRNYQGQELDRDWYEERLNHLQRLLTSLRRY